MRGSLPTNLWGDLMARLLWLPDVLRAAGLTVHVVDGWKTRGKDTFGPVRGITCHGTGGGVSGTDKDEIRTLVRGRPDLSPPIAQLYLSRSGAWFVVASGTAHHNSMGWAGPNKGFGNDRLLGIEAQHNNRSEPWTVTQYTSYVRGVAALARKLDIPVRRIAGHKEHQPCPAPSDDVDCKGDPTLNMTKFRAAVAAVLAGEDNDVGTLEGKQAQMLADIHFTLTAIPNPDGGRRVPHHVAMSAFDAALDLLAKKVGVTAAQLTEVKSAAAAGAQQGLTAAADQIVAAILARLPENTVAKADVEAAVAAGVNEVLLEGSVPQD